MLQKDLLPSVFAYLKELTQTALQKKELLPSLTTKAEETLIERLSGLADDISGHIDRLHTLAQTAEETGEPLDAGSFYHSVVLPEMEAARLAANEAEALIPDDFLPYPTYDSLLFYA